jgi:hypothetical protein
MGQEVGTMHFFRVQRGAIKKIKGVQIKNQNSDVKVSLPNV